jgi:hypothetical protein
LEEKHAVDEGLDTAPITSTPMNPFIVPYEGSDDEEEGDLADDEFEEDD